jgi:hypothetical protein
VFTPEVLNVMFEKNTTTPLKSASKKALFNVVVAALVLKVPLE